MTVCVDRNWRGAWEVGLPGGGKPITCETIDEARRVARQYAPRTRPCEAIVRDAYHRVLQREFIAGTGTSAPVRKRSASVRAGSRS